MTLHEVLLKVIAERAHQDKKWGKQRHSLDAWMVILMEEIGEAAKAINEASTYIAQVTKGIKKYDSEMVFGLEDNIENELIQAAAVIVAFLQFYEFNNPIAEMDNHIAEFNQEFAAAVARAFNDHFKEAQDGA